MPEKVECRFCGRVYGEDETECAHCGGALSDAVRTIVCDRCGHRLGDGIDAVGGCVTCGKPVYLCAKHRKKIVEDEIYCKEHESECFIATAVIGTPLDPKIDLLRFFRDSWLISNPLGRAAVFTYYEVSPPIARAARRNETLKRILRNIVVEPGLRFARIILSRN